MSGADPCGVPGLLDTGWLASGWLVSNWLVSGWLDVVVGCSVSVGLASSLSTALVEVADVEVVPGVVAVVTRFGGVAMRRPPVACTEVLGATVRVGAE